MKNNHFLPFFALLLIGYSAAGQNNAITVGFLINGVALEPLPYRPTSPDDKDHVLRVNPEVAVMLRDVSTGAAARDYRYWDFDGDMKWDTVSQEATVVSHAYPTAGFYAVKYCVGNTTQCATRWVFVNGPETPKQKSKSKKKSKPQKPSPFGDDMEPTSTDASSPPPPPPPPPAPVPQVEMVEEIPEMPEPVVLSSAPRSMEAPDIFLKTGRAGIPLSKYTTAQSCVTKTKSSFTATLQPKTAMDLVSFVVYATDCGGLNLTISGPDISETEKIVLIKGKNLIDLEAYDIRLRAGNLYTITGTGIAGFGGCFSTKLPMFEDVSKCTTVTSENHPNLTVDQKKSPVVFELRFLHQ